MPVKTARIGLTMFALLSSSVMATADPITFTDHLGRNITLEGIPQHVVAAASPSGSMVVTMAQDGETLVGTSKNAHNAMMEGVLHEFFPGLENVSANLISTSDTTNIEEVLRLDPDMVLQWARKEDSIAAMEAVGLNVVALKYAKIDIANTWLTTIATAFEETKRVERILAWHDSRLQEITALTSQIANEDKPSVMYLLGEGKAAGTTGHFQYFMDIAGAKNAIDVAKNGLKVDPEMVLQANPDIIWLFGFNMGLTPEVIYNNPIYADVNAVQNRRVYKVPVGGDRWDPPNQEFPLAWEWFTRTAHPDLLPGSIRDSIRDAYPMLYGQTPTDAQLDLILRMNMNGDAADYKVIAR